MPRKPAPPPPPTPRRRPVTPADVAISAEVNRLRAERDLSIRDLAAAAGRSPDNGQRLLRSEGPGHGWTVAELGDYARALGVDPGVILSAAGVISPAVSLVERIIADPDLSPADRTTLVGIVAVMRRNPG